MRASVSLCSRFAPPINILLMKRVAELQEKVGRRAGGFVTEFWKFAAKGNVFDLAVAVIIGGAFGKIVSSLVDTVIMPTIGLILGGINFTGWVFQVGEATIAYGKLIQSIIDFVIIAFLIFVALRALNKFKRKEAEENVVRAPSEDILLLREIRDSLKREK